MSDDSLKTIIRLAKTPINHFILNIGKQSSGTEDFRKVAKSLADYSQELRYIGGNPQHAEKLLVLENYLPVSHHEKGKTIFEVKVDARGVGAVHIADNRRVRTFQNVEGLATILDALVKDITEGRDISLAKEGSHERNLGVHPRVLVTGGSPAAQTR